MKMYGIKNCDTIKKARAALDGRGIAYQFHDYKKEGVDKAALGRWVDELGWEVLLNTRGTTWRSLPEATRAGVVDVPSAMAVMLDNPSVIKRPVLEGSAKTIVGFDAGVYGEL